MPGVISTTNLKDLIGADSHTLLKLLPATSNFIDLHPKTWLQNADFAVVKAMIENLPAINDAAEKSIGSYHKHPFFSFCSKTASQ